jgi:hypothetical protein
MEHPRDFIASLCALMMESNFAAANAKEHRESERIYTSVGI